MTATTPVEKSIEKKVTQGAELVAADPKVKMDQSAVRPVVDEIMGKILPTILHATNNEPWYRSRVFWSSMLSIVATLVGVFGISFPAEVQTQVLVAIMAAIPAVSAAIALWSRYVSTKPLGK